MEISSVFSGDTLKAADLQGHEPTVIIASVEQKKFDNGNKLVIKFEGKKKSLVCNKTNANRIAYVYGTNTDGWIGKEITLFTDLVDFQGSTVEAIRVRPPKRDNITTAPQRMASTPLPTNGRNPQDAMDEEIPF